MIIKTESDAMVQQLTDQRFSNQSLRILSALFLIPFVLTVIYLGFPYFDLLAIIATGMLIKEWSSMSLSTASNPFPYVISALTLGILYLDLSLTKYFQYLAGVVAVFAIFYFAQRRCIKGFILHLIGTLYISWSFYLILYFMQEGLTLYFIWILLVVWSCDSGAYFVGKKIGGPKLAPKMSPNKTWAGFIGGIVIAIMVGTVSGYYLQDLYPKGPQMAMVSLYFALMCHLGDLLESIVKRYFNVKDSGCIIPGHGGFLDRLDSTLLASFAAGLLLILGI